MTPDLITGCSHPHKTAYWTKRKAKQALRGQRAFQRDTIHAYRCVCGAYHLGHKLSGDGRN